MLCRRGLLEIFSGSARRLRLKRKMSSFASPSCRIDWIVLLLSCHSWKQASHWRTARLQRQQTQTARPIPRTTKRSTITHAHTGSTGCSIRRHLPAETNGNQIKTCGRGSGLEWVIDKLHYKSVIPLSDMARNRLRSGF